MKSVEHKEAIFLRRNGLTYKEIGDKLCVSKGALSRWLRDVPYEASDESNKRRREASVRNGRLLHSRKLKRVEKIRRDSKFDIENDKSQTFKMLGAMAYLCEGSKTSDSIVKFTNSDPKLVCFMLKWLRVVCGVSQDKVRLHLRIHKGEDVLSIRKYWAQITGIPLKQFYKTTLKRSDTDGKRISKLPYGIASIVVCDTDLFYKIQGWTEALIESC